MADEEAETYIVGNPPYLGYNRQTEEQKGDVEAVAGRYTDSWRSLDYISCWFLKAAEMCDRRSQAAFVSTNSICQGEHASILWPHLFGLGAEIGFAHRSFKWVNNAASNAAVICVVIGLRSETNAPAFLYDGGSVKKCDNISQYLTDAPSIVIEPRRRPLSAVPQMILGNMPKDGGHLVLDAAEREQLITDHPEAETYVRRFIGSQEAIRGVERYCLWIEDRQVEEAERIPNIASRLEGVREMRSASPAASTRAFADRPHRFKQIQGVAREHAIVVPQVSSERRRYLPVEFVDSAPIISNLAFALYDAPLWTPGIIASRLHLLWIETVCGKLKSDFRYSNTMGWHTFPLPTLAASDRDRLNACAEEILVARAEAGGTLAELYDPDGMPEVLRQAHDENDRVIERIYSNRPFRSDAYRLNHLFRRYARMIAAERGEEVSPEFDLDAEEIAA